MPNATDNSELSNRLREHVEHLAGLIGPRHLNRPSSVEATLAVIEHAFSEIGDQVRQESYYVGEQVATNLIVERRGTTWPDEVLILGAHYDTVPETPGADDNASAVAVLIETARLLAGRKMRRTVRFVAFACEEPPHFYTQSMGSYIHAKGCFERREKLIGMLCLEMVGYYTDAPRSQRVPEQIPRWLRWLFPTRGNFLVAVGDVRSAWFGWRFRCGFKGATRFPLFSVALPRAVGPISLSDHASFWDYGYRALMLTDTSFFRNPNYHTPRDTPETLDYDRMADVTRGVAGAIARICG